MPNSDPALEQLFANLRTPLESFYHYEQSTPDKLCFVQPLPSGDLLEFTWAEAGQIVRKVATYLDSLNLPAGSNIALMSNNCAYWIIADLAIWMAGHCSIPLYPNLSAKSIQQVMQHSESKVMFAGKLLGWEEMRKGVPEDCHLINFPLSPPNIQTDAKWSDIVAEHPAMQDSPVFPKSNVGTIIYTSGTTGMPKGVMHSFQSLGVVGYLGGELYSASADERKLSYLPLAHVAERAAIELNQLYCGYTVYFNHSLDTFADDLRRASPTLFFAVPRIWKKLQMRVLENIDNTTLQAMLDDPAQAPAIKAKLLGALGMQNIRVAISGAAPLPTSLIEWFSRLGLDILEGYAMSENLAYSHTTATGEAKAGYVGTPNPYVECKLGENGEVLCKSPSNLVGYYKQAELTAEVLDADGFFHTGDKGELDQQGRLRIIGRTKELFKTSKGKYVAPAPIEDLLSQNLDIELVCVTGHALPQAIALINLSDEAKARLADHGAQSLVDSLSETLNATNAALDKHEHLSHIVVTKTQWGIDNGLITPTLKVKRAELEALLNSKFEEWQSHPEKIIFE